MSSGKSSSATRERSKSKPRPSRSAAKERARIQHNPAAQSSNGANPASKTQANDAPSNGKAAIEGTQIHSATAAYAFLALAAETLEDVERTRIAAENRARALTHPEQNIGLAESDPLVEQAQALADQLLAIEKDAEKALKRTLRLTPLSDWVKGATGVGEKQAARLLGVIGDPRIRFDNETGEIHERTVGQLWAYCGYSVVPADQAGPGTHRSDVGVAPRRKRGQQGNWNAKARMRAYLIAESCMKSPTSPYRRLYEEAREKYAGSKHKAPCAQCGQKGKPAEVGTDLRDGHKHARALRIVAKEVLKDLWIAADQTSGG